MSSVIEATRDRVRELAGRTVLTGLSMSGDLGARIADPRHRDDPYPHYEALRRQGRVVRTRLGPMTASHDLCGAILRDPRFGHGPDGQLNRDRDIGVMLPPDPAIVDPLGPESMIGMDPPDHTRLRTLVSKAFTPRAIAGMRGRITEIAARLLDEPVRTGAFDFMTDFASPLPVIVICELLGVPAEDEGRFREWNRETAASLDMASSLGTQRRARRALGELQAYLEALFAKRRAEPRDDLVSSLLAVEDEGDRLSPRELLATVVLLLIAGFETTINLLGNGMLALLRHPTQLAMLREDPDRIPNAVEEMLRWDGVVQLTARQALVTVDLEGVTVPAGEDMILVLAGANRDPKVFTDPQRFDVSRANARQHLGFAAGPHHCLGAALARLEAEVAFRVLLERLPVVALAGRPTRRPTFLLRGLTSLPLHATSMA